MFKRVVLGLIVLLSIAWIAYVGLDIASEKNNYIPEILFSADDESLLIVVRPEETNFSAIVDLQDAPTMDLMTQLSDSMYELGYFSAKRPHFLLVGELNWDKAKINALFTQSKPQFSDENQFTIDGFSGRFYKQKLYISKGEIKQSGSANQEFNYDKKASATLFKLGPSGTKTQIDIYFKEDGRVNFITRNVQIKQGNQVKDESIFAGLISKNVSSYHFYERDYFATLDSKYAEGPMSQWNLNGFVLVEIDGERAIVSDYIGGQDPILVLNDINQTLDTARFKNPLFTGFPAAGKSYIIKYLEDVVVISEKSSTCDKLLADYRLGNTIASSKKDRARIFGELPRAVSERSVSDAESFSKSVYHGRIMETHTGVSSPKETETKSDAIYLSCGFDIADFDVLPGKGNAVALGKRGELTYFANKQAKWTKKLESKAIGAIQLIDLHETGQKFILVNTASEIHLFNLEGNEETGFPIKLESNATNQVKFYRWKGNSFFLIADDAQKVSQFDAKGRELNVFKSSFIIRDQIDIWVSQSRIFAGFKGDSEFTMFELEKRKALRTFSIVSGSKSIKASNQLFQFAMQNGTLQKMDQKGSRIELGKHPDSKLIGVIEDNRSQVIVLQNNDGIELLNDQGIAFGSIKLPFRDVENLTIKTADSGKTYVCVIDGLENNVYLYSTDGAKLTSKSLEGQTKVHLQFVAGTKCISTVVDQFVIQYFEN